MRATEKLQLKEKEGYTAYVYLLRCCRVKVDVRVHERIQETQVSTSDLEKYMSDVLGGLQNAPSSRA